MATGSGLSIDVGELDRHLHSVPPLLLRHEEARHKPGQTSLERSSSAIPGLDYSIFLPSSTLDWWLRYIPARPVSIANS